MSRTSIWSGPLNGLQNTVSDFSRPYFQNAPSRLKFQSWTFKFGRRMSTTWSKKCGTERVCSCANASFRQLGSGQWYVAIDTWKDKKYSRPHFFFIALYSFSRPNLKVRLSNSSLDEEVLRSLLRVSKLLFAIPFKTRATRLVYGLTPTTASAGHWIFESASILLGKSKHLSHGLTCRPGDTGWPC